MSSHNGKGIQSPSFMGVLHSDRLKGKELFSFEYDEKWLKKAGSQLLDPNLQLYSGLHHIGENQQNFGVFLDSSPDRWGRVLMRRREAALARKEKGKNRSYLKPTTFLECLMVTEWEHLDLN